MTDATGADRLIRPVDLPERSMPMPKGPFVKVRTGKSSYLKLSEAEAEAYRARYGEYGVPEPVDPRAEVDDLDRLTVPELQALAGNQGIDFKGLKKAELLAALREAAS